MEDYKRRTIESYNKNAEELSKKFERLTDLIRRKEFSIFENLLDNRGKILDLGCGSGDHSVYFRDKGFEVVSLDLSDGMLEICKGKGLNIVKMDIENLNLEKRSFDGIWAVTSLLHVPKGKMKDVLKSLSSILKDRGILHVAVKKGKGERFVEDGRFFSFWDKDEFLGLTKDYFELSNYMEETVDSRSFIHFFLRKN